MHKKFEINRTKIKGGCQSERKVVPHDSKSIRKQLTKRDANFGATHVYFVDKLWTTPNFVFVSVQTNRVAPI